MKRISGYLFFCLVLATSVNAFSKLNYDNNPASTINYIGWIDSKPMYNRLELNINDPTLGRSTYYFDRTNKNCEDCFSKDLSGRSFLRYDFREISKDKMGALHATLIVAKPSPTKTLTRLIANTSAFLFLRNGSQVVLNGDVSSMIPGLNFPVGGIALVSLGEDKRSKESEIIIGNVGKIIDVTESCGSCRNNAVKAVIKQVRDECARGQSEWDLVFAWQPPILPAVSTFNTTHKYAHSHLVEKGFFATVEPIVGTNCNTLNQLPCYTDADNAWVLGWSVDGFTDKLVKLGLSKNLTPVGKGKIKVGAYLMGAMHPQAEAAWYRDESTNDADTINGKQIDLAVLTGTELPMIARDGSGGMSGQFGQLIVTGRTFWLKNNHWSGNLLLQSDQHLLEDELSKQKKCPRCYGTTVTFAALLPIIK